MGLRILKHLLLVLIGTLFLFACKEKSGEYVCPPCDLPCDKLTFEKAGICPHCKMTLVKKSELIDESALELNRVELNKGSGVFLVEGAKGKEEKSIKVYYHRPENFSAASRILMVIPGAGRNGNSYRDAWIEESEKHGALILSPMYEEEKYPFEEYHLCGLIKDLNLNESIKFEENSNIARLNEDLLKFQINTNSEDWLFNDFDRIFEMVTESLVSTQVKYDVFGHSAGGQILHRKALFSNESKVDRIIAANSGFYTLPDTETKMPFGVMNMEIDDEDLAKAFSKKLVVLVGALDNENEQGGTLLRSSTVDLQGVHRLERAKYFYKYSQNKANEIKADFNWTLEIVLNVGHDHKLMGDAAAKLLYE